MSTCNWAPGSADFAAGDATMPCRRWDNFLPTDQKLSFMDPSGNLNVGSYKLEYTCMWRNGDKSAVPGTTVTGSFSFNVQAGCPMWLDEKQLSVAETLLLSSPGFITADCSAADQTKEAIFRKLDLDVDGTLSTKEQIAALERNHVDQSYALQLANNGVSLGDMAKGRVRPATCTTPQPQYYS